VGNKVCSLIIDGGSCANVASKTMVDKLKLQVSPRPNPYTIKWLNQGKGLQITHRCLVSFSIGKNYKDEIWCDIVPMDACHILLGRPWLFDRSVIHDGWMNTNSFKKYHKKITLLLSKFHPPLDPKTILPWISFSPLSSNPSTMNLSLSKTWFFYKRTLSHHLPHIHYSPLSFKPTIMSFHKRSHMAFPLIDPSNTR